MRQTHDKAFQQEAVHKAFQQEAVHEEMIQALGKCTQMYQNLLLANNALDFSTIQYEALQLLRQHPDGRDALKERIILELVGTDSPNLCVVGDDDQGIYRFRGATIHNILQFDENFTQPVRQVSLKTNYRSHPDSSNFCQQWMATQEWEHAGQQFR
jgi:ATP-dependent DNA helicase UvrD/PcrA